VHLAVELDLLEELAAVGFQRAAVVVELDAADEGDEPVGDHRRNLARDHLVLPLLAPARDHVDDLGRAAELEERLVNLQVERAQIRLLVQDRQEERNLRRDRPAAARAPVHGHRLVLRPGRHVDDSLFFVVNLHQLDLILTQQLFRRTGGTRNKRRR
jgi:hypothetical protein